MNTTAPVISYVIVYKVWISSCLPFLKYGENDEIQGKIQDVIRYFWETY